MNGSAPRTAAEALASADSARTLACQPLAVAQHAGEIAERLGQIAAGLLLDGDDDGEEAHLRHRHARHHALEGLAQRDADALLLDELGELACSPAPAIRGR